MRIRHVLPILATLLPALPLAAQDMAEVSLLPGWVMENGNRVVGVQISLAPGWKTYWRAPQGNGIPPDFDFSGSSNLASADVHWPKPKVFETYGIRSVGYEERVIFPLELTPDQPGQPIGLSLDLFFGVCEDVCIPEEQSVTLSVPVVMDGPSAVQIRESYASRSIPAAAAGISMQSCAVSGAGQKRGVAASLTYASAMSEPEMVVWESGSELVWLSVEAVTATGPDLSIEGTASYYGDGAFDLDRGGMRLSLIGAGPVVELIGCPVE